MPQSPPASSSHPPFSISALLQLEQPALVLLDSKYKIVAANKGACLLIGFEPDQILGLDFFSLFEPVERERLLDSMTSGMPQTGLEVQLVTAQGRRIPVGVCCAAAEGQIAVAMWDLQPLWDLKNLANEARDRVDRISNMGGCGHHSL